MTNRPAATWNFEDDPRLTAYALGELPEGERAEIDALLVGNAAAQRFVEETRGLAAVLQAEFGDSANLLSCAASSSEQPGVPDAQLSKFALSPTQRDAVRAAANPRGAATATSASPGSGRPRILRVENWAIPARIAAVALVAVAFAQRREIGEWWTGGDRDVARFVPSGDHFERRLKSAALPTLDNISSDYSTDDGDDGTSVSAANIDSYAGAGGGGNTTTRPGSGAFLNNNSDGDYRGRVENVFDRALEPGRFREAGGGGGFANGYTGGGGGGGGPRVGLVITRAGGRPLIQARGGGSGGGAGAPGNWDAGRNGVSGAGSSKVLLPDGRSNDRTYTTATWGADPTAGAGVLTGSQVKPGVPTQAADTGGTIQSLKAAGRLVAGDVNLDPTFELTTAEEAPEGQELTSDLGARVRRLYDLTDQAKLNVQELDPRVAVLFTTRDEPVNDGTLTLNFLKSEGLFDPRITTANFDVEIAQAAAIGDPAVRRAKLVGIVEKAQQRAEGSSLGYTPAEGNPAGYAPVEDNPFRTVPDSPLSTFGIDVDTASYANVRRFLDSGALPPPGAVRIEEMVNYFPYRYAPPANGDPFAVHVEVAGCPWNTAHRLVRVGLKGREIDLRERPQSNLVFLLDVSGSMQPENRLPLVVQSMRRLVEQLDARDKVAIVVYAGAAGMVLPPTAGDQHATILGALDRLQAGGSTAGAAGIELAYKIAQENFVKGGTNRVILATDGDFNVGVSDDSSLVKMIEEKAKSSVFLSVLGVGDDNLQDAKMEQLADKGNGNYSYLDSLKEGSKVLVEQAAGTLMTIAKDVKLQIEFNPVRVAGYRLIGYENRVLATEDFANDRKDAGDMGAGHTVTALYEIVPTTTTAPAAATEPLRYQRPATPTDTAQTNEILAVKLRFKQPEGDVSVLREVPVTDSGAAFDGASADFHFAAAVAGFGMLLRNSEHKGTATYDMVAELAMSGLSTDPGIERAGFVDLVRKAKAIATGATLPK